MLYLIGIELKASESETSYQKSYRANIATNLHSLIEKWSTLVYKYHLQKLQHFIIFGLWSILDYVLPKDKYVLKFVF